MDEEILVQKDCVVKALASLKLRAEKGGAEKGGTEETLLKSFVPIVSFESLSAANTQIIFGRNGTGKTHLGVSICKEWVKVGVPAKYILVSILLDELRQGYKHESGDYDRIESVIPRLSGSAFKVHG